MVIGITGNSGSGKSEISKKLANILNAIIIDADKEAKLLAEPGNIYYKKIVKKFGKKILEGENINRVKLAEIIYNNKKNRNKLNRLTNKYVVKQIKKIVKSKKDNNIILDVPLLFESKLDKICDVTIAILANEENKIQRIMKRDKITKIVAKQRLAIQAKEEYYKEKADYIVENNDEINEKYLEELCTKIGKT